MAFNAKANRDLPEERTILMPVERREAVLSVIGSAKHRLLLSLFRCDDVKILDELAAALRRGVKVRVLLTSRAKGGKKRLRELWTCLENLGAQVHPYSDPIVKYHAKYIVADDGPALVASLNFTRKCFEETCDFIQVTRDREVVDGLNSLFEADCRSSQLQLPEKLTDRLIVGPQRARAQLTALLKQARRSIQIIDHKLTDPSVIVLLDAKKAEGVAVEVLRGRRVGSFRSHGKMILVDRETAVIGSIALSALSLGFRRELALLVQDAECVGCLNAFFHEMYSGMARDDTVAEVPEDDEDDDPEEA